MVSFHRLCVWTSLIKAKIFYNFYPTELYCWLLLKQMHQIAGNILQRIPSSFRFSNIRFQNIDSTPPYFYFKKIDQDNRFLPLLDYWFVLVAVFCNDDAPAAGGC